MNSQTDARHDMVCLYWSIPAVTKTDLGSKPDGPLSYNLRLTATWTPVPLEGRSGRRKSPSDFAAN